MDLAWRTPAPVDAVADDRGRRDDTGDLRHRMVRAMMWTAVVLIVIMRLIAARQNSLPWPAVFAAMLPYPPLVALLTNPRRPDVRLALLISVAVCYALPFALCGLRWDWMPWPVAAAVLCAFRGRVGWPLFGVILLANLLGRLGSGSRALPSIELTLRLADDGMIVFGLYALVAMVTGLHATRGELAELRLRSERQRLDGNLHAAGGTRLRTLAGELDRVLEEASAEGTGHEAARARLGDAVTSARETLAEIRAAACDLREFRPVAPIPIESPAVARWMLVGVFFCDGTVQVVDDVVVYGASWRTLVVVPVLLAGAAVLLPIRPARPTRATRRQLIAYALIMGPAVIPGGYVILDLDGLANLWTFFAGMMFVCVRRPLSWAVFALALGGYLSLAYYPPPVASPIVQIGDVVSFVILTWLAYSLVRLSELVEILHRARQDLAAEAVTRERIRVARELHDRLSFGISVIALKGELCERMLRSDPHGALGHLSALPTVARDALAELESLTGSPVGLRFDQELERAREMLESAGAQPIVVLDDGRWAPEVDTSMAVVLRETVTNVVKHSRAQTCSITVTCLPGEGLVRLSVVNDGVTPGAAASRPRGFRNSQCAQDVRKDQDTRDAPDRPHDRPHRPGSGLIGIAERTGGRVTAGHRPGGRFEVVAEFAAAPATAPDPAAPAIPALPAA